MKFVPILKDSLREAIDTKVFYVMVGLSALLTLVTATLSFKPAAPDRIMQLMTLPLLGEMTDLSPDRIMQLMVNAEKYQIAGAEPRDGAPEGPSSPYVVTLAVRCKSEAE